MPVARYRKIPIFIWNLSERSKVELENNWFFNMYVISFLSWKIKDMRLSDHESAKYDNVAFILRKNIQTFTKECPLDIQEIRYEPIKK